MTMILGISAVREQSRESRNLGMSEGRSSIKYVQAVLETETTVASGSSAISVVGDMPTWAAGWTMMKIAYVFNICQGGSA